MSAIIATVMVAIPTIIPTAVPPMPAVFTPDVMTMNPLVAVTRPLARHPNHLPVTIPVSRATIVGSIPDLYADPACICERWNKRGRNNRNRD